MNHANRNMIQSAKPENKQLLRRISVACAVFLLPFVTTQFGCKPQVTEKVDYNQQDAEIIREQIKELYSE